MAEPVFKAQIKMIGRSLALALLLSSTALTLPALAETQDAKLQAADEAAEAAAQEPMTLIVSLRDQTVDIYRGTNLITTSKVSSGKPGYTTKSGVFTILEKKRRHYSNLYNGAPMPYMQRLTWSGTALHAGVVPNYPASHGCIRLPSGFAPKLFGMTGVGEHVVVTRDHPKPQIIEHANLFQPMPMPTPPVLAKDDREQHAELGTGGNAQKKMAEAASPLLLAKVDVSSEDADAAAAENDTIAAAKDAPHAVEPDEAMPAPHAVGAGDSSYDHAIDVGGKDGAKVHAAVLDDDAAEAHPVKVDRPPSEAAKAISAGGDETAVAAAEPRNDEPLRILITKATQRDKIRGVQFQLSDLGYLEPQMFDGTFGRLTIDAIKSFQADHDMPQTGAVTDDVVAAIYEENGKEVPPSSHLFVRRKFDRLYDAPVALKNPEEPIGTHVFTAMDFSDGDDKARWMAVSTNGGDPYAALDRIEVPENVRRWISERLTPGSSLIIADTAINTAALPKGADFVVLANDPGKPAVRRVSNPVPQVRERRRYVEPDRRRERRRNRPFWFRY
ncbi:L,D-transpeptidase family protein [Methyloligella sp. 2.7D]|uniref:L,D-transpeptidase family protein n=1 Tax=unclassified Methyloligella TaxID=2625955 RepID=UPI00157D7623|nr:L,D-transpeptidase family protein [Methyloligella sp. GL2]QKP76202.1 L,D-transpeptidase family protein [Methyloligella sp. GL2]